MIILTKYGHKLNHTCENQYHKSFQLATSVIHLLNKMKRKLWFQEYYDTIFEWRFYKAKSSNYWIICIILNLSLIIINSSFENIYTNCIPCHISLSQKCLFNFLVSTKNIFVRDQQEMQQLSFLIHFI